MSARPILFTLLAGLLMWNVAGAQGTDQVLATVNGTKITESDVQEYVRDHQMGARAAGNRDQILNELIGRELVYQDAMKQNLEKEKAVQEQMAELRRQVLLNAALEKALAKDPVTEEEMKKVYEQRVASAPSQREFKARHILVGTEEEAKKLIDQLGTGADFAELAKKHSTGPSGKQGGDLGWFNPQQMVPEFSQATAKLEKGGITKQPVKTQFGWHVIKLEDSRAVEPPPFEQVKPQLEQLLTQQKVSEYISRLRTEGKVDLKTK